MRDPEVERVAELLAAHAVLVLGLIVVAVLVSLVGVIAAVRIAARFQDPLRRAFMAVLRQAQSLEPVSGILTRTSAFVPSGYLALHLVLGLALTAAATIFFVVAEEVVGGGEMAAFDVAFARALRNTVTPGWERFFAAVSWFGSREVLAVATLGVAVGLLIRDGAMIAIGWTVAQAGGGLLNLTLKQVFERTRPDSADPLLASSSWSFPSGHAMGTFVLCGVGCYLLLRDVRSWLTTGVVIAAAVLWCVVVGFSRLYLGVHFASDVSAGLFGGAAWVAVCVSAFEIVRRRGDRSKV